jgi:hypothetical protein
MAVWPVGEGGGEPKQDADYKSSEPESVILTFRHTFLTHVRRMALSDVSALDPSLPHSLIERLSSLARFLLRARERGKSIV